VYSFTQQRTAKIDSAAYTQTYPPGGSTGSGAESDIYDCFVVLAELTGAHEGLVTYGFREKPRGLLFQETIFTCMAVLQW